MHIVNRQASTKKEKKNVNRRKSKHKHSGYTAESEWINFMGKGSEMLWDIAFINLHQTAVVGFSILANMSVKMQLVANFLNEPLIK